MIQENQTSDVDLKGGAGYTTHLFLVLCVIATASFFFWASVGTLDIVSQTSGEVIPSSQLKSIQHLEGGIVREIAIREGENVKENQKLVVLEPTQSGADVGELRVRLASLTAEIARLEAEAAGTDLPVFPTGFEKTHPRLVKQAAIIMNSRKKALQSRITSQKEAVNQRQQEIKEISARIRNRKHSLKLLEEQIAISEDLLKDDLTNRYVHLNLLKEASQLKSQNEEDAAAVQRGKAALKEAESNLEGIRNTFVEETEQELETVHLEFDELSQRVQKYQDSLERTVLRSPVDGVIKTLHISTVGGVLRPGETVVDIVPADDRLVIEARLPTQDIGYVRPGQSVLVKLASSDAMRFGGLDGTVASISPDTLTTEDGLPYYKVRIETVSDRFERGELQYHLFPGMQVVTSIRTGQRTVLEYLTDPFLNSMSGAMLER